MNEQEKESATPEMDRLADELVRGERTFLAPPGVWAFLGALFTTAFGLAFLLVNAAPVVLGLTSREDRSDAEILSLQLGWIIPCLFGLMAAKGVPYTGVVWRRFVDIALIGSVVLLALRFDNDTLRTRFLIASGLLLVAFLILRSVGFAVGILFRQRVKARREAFFAKRREIAFPNSNDR